MMAKLMESLPARQRRQRHDTESTDGDNQPQSIDTNEAAPAAPSSQLTSELNFEYVDHTADVGIKAWGKTLDDAFCAAGLGLFSYMTDLVKIELKEMREFTVAEDDRKEIEMVLYHFLDELLFLYGSEYFIAKTIEIVEADWEEMKLKCRCWGEKFDYSRHSQGTEVKAITMHEMRVENNADKVTVWALLDI